MRWGWIVLLGAGCGPAVDVGADLEGSTSSTSVNGTSEATAAPGDGPSVGVASTSATTASATTSDDGPSGSSGSDDSSGEGGVTFIDDPTGSCGSIPDDVLAHCTIPVGCSLTEQDCPEGEACRAWANDGGDVWNAERCVPVDADPGQAGDSCSIEGSSVSGIDSCDVGLMCWNFDPETLEGACIAFCAGDDPEVGCEDAADSCSVHNEGYLPLCLPACEPLGASCGEGFGCYPGSEGDFVCLREGERVELDSLFHPECPSGTFWATEAQVAGCTDDEPCCAAYCDSSAPSPCGVDVACVPFFEVQDPDFPNLGYCQAEAP